MFDLKKIFPSEIVALTLYGEARGECIEGQVAVANVIMNRFKDGHFDHIGEVCLAPKQFSCWNENDGNKKILDELIEKLIKNIPLKNATFSQCLFIAQGVINGQLLDNVRGNVNYMTKSLFNSGARPAWASNPKKFMEIDNHVFFTA